MFRFLLIVKLEKRPLPEKLKFESSAHLYLIAFHILFKLPPLSWVLVAHAYNPSSSGGRQQEDCVM
jgi:hypothetical protein